MYAVGRLGSYISRGVYSVSAPFHPFGGAVDIIVVEQPDGSFKSSPWYVRFGKFQGVLKASTKVVSICVNGNEANFHMFLDNKGEAYFLREVDFKEGESEAVSFPFPSGYETDEPSSGNRRPMKSISCNSDADKSNSEGQVVVRNEKVVARTSSHGSRIYGLVFGQRSTKEDGYQEESVGAAVKNAGSLEPADIASELLDIKWSTNLASNRSNDNASQFSSAKDALDNKGSEGEMQINEEENRFQSSVHDKEEETNDEENQFQSSVHDKAENVNDEKNQFHSSVHDKEGNSIDRQILLDEKVSCSHSGLENLEYSVEESSIQVFCISAEQQIVENSSSSDGMEDKYRVIANVSGSIDDHNVGNFDDNENEMDDDNAENINDEENQFHTSVHDKEGNSIDWQTLLDEKVSCSHSGLENLDYSVEESSKQVSCVSTKQQIVENSSLSLVMEDKYRVIANISGSIDDRSVGNFDDNENEIGAVSGMSVPDLQSQYKPEECADKQVDEEPADNERNVVLPGCDISSKETVLERVQSFVYCETSESSVITLDGTSEQTQQTLCVSDVGNGKVHVHAETLVTMTEPVPEVTILKQAEYVELDSEGAITASDSYSQTVSVDPVICSVEEMKSDIIHSTSTVNDLGDQVEDGKNTVDVLQPSLESVDDSQNFYGDSDPRRSVAPSESSEIVQFLFSDLDELKLHESDSVNKDLRPSICPENEEVNGLCNINNESYLNPDEFIWENPSTDLEKSVEKLRIVSNPISISRNHRVAVEKNGWQVKSLPNTVTKFDASNHHPLSHSLDSNSETMKWTLIRKDGSNCMRSDADEEQPLAQEKSSGEESETFEKLKSTLYNPAVEISLCKHLLYEGMGTEAACQVFDAEKLDSKKVNSMDPVLVKNDRLVVRIAGHYFPWDAAAPILSGMDTFGTREIFESKGMILVDRVEKSIEGDPSKAIVSSRGSWRIWPFSLKRSRSRKAVQRAPADTRDLDAENAADGTVASDNDKILQKPKQMKKMIREITPTSEQLASLSLKDGMNHITFTFSTAMLGKQQVDARIYLWKWNTRIVVSDVDGTITKSDVLGQFMPLVGMDWSQTGVAHLFSSIKENGYQLLFLSARAISQAYLTRKFLANLKQDGKALPDGPIVISPDGLFPSLYREVIRRVPQEFKIACLEEIMALFPSDCKPFYAGFGNRDTDEISYVKVGIPKGKIFIINPKGEVAVNRLVDTKSYSSLHALVHDMFPPMASEQEDFNSWNFWKLPPPLIDM